MFCQTRRNLLYFGLLRPGTGGRGCAGAGVVEGEKGGKMTPEQVDKLITFGQMALEQGWYDQARDYFEQALALDPSNREAMKGLARVSEILSRRAATVVEPIEAEIRAESLLAKGISPRLSSAREWIDKQREERAERAAERERLAADKREDQAREIARPKEEFQQNRRIAMETRFSLSRHMASGALFASLIGAIWVLRYLITTTYGMTPTTIFGTTYSSPLVWEYVIGTQHNLKEFGSEALFVVVTRFLVAFGVSWSPITVVIATFRALTTTSRK